MVVADEAVKKGLDKSPEVAEQTECDEAIGARQRVRPGLLKNNPVTDEMLKAEYDRIKAQIGGGNQYKARHILVDKEADAKDIIARLKKDPMPSRSSRPSGRRIRVRRPGRRSRMVRSDPDGAGVRRRR
jgi:peptidyl-prolyl cis-trans isomerase C